MVSEVKNMLDLKNNYLELGKLFISVIDGFSQGVLITNLEDKIIYSNFKLAQITGYKRKELLGKSPGLFMNYPNKFKNLTGLAGIKGTGIFESHEVFIRRKSGETFLAHALTSAFRDASENISGTITVLSEVRISRKDHELKAIAQAAAKSANSIAILNKFGKIEWVNEGFTELTGYELFEVIDKGFDQFQNDLFNTPHQERLTEVLRTKEKTTYYWSGFKKNGDAYQVVRSLTPNLDHNREVKELVVIDTDITDLADKGMHWQ